MNTVFSPHILSYNSHFFHLPLFVNSSFNMEDKLLNDGRLFGSLFQHDVITLYLKWNRMHYCKD